MAPSAMCVRAYRRGGALVAVLTSVAARYDSRSVRLRRCTTQRQVVHVVPLTGTIPTQEPAALKLAARTDSTTAIPEDTRATDNIVSGHPLRLCSKLRNNAFSLSRETNYCTVWKWDRAEGATI